MKYVRLMVIFIIFGKIDRFCRFIKKVANTYIDSVNNSTTPPTPPEGIHTYSLSLRISFDVISPSVRIAR